MSDSLSLWLPLSEHLWQTPDIITLEGGLVVMCGDPLCSAVQSEGVRFDLDAKLLVLRQKASC